MSVGIPPRLPVDIQLPPPASPWPPAPGFMLLAVLVLATLVWFTLRVRRRYLRHTPLRRAKQQLTQLQNLLQGEQISPTVALASATRVLKRMAESTEIRPNRRYSTGQMLTEYYATASTAAGRSKQPQPPSAVPAALELFLDARRFQATTVSSQQVRGSIRVLSEELSSLFAYLLAGVREVKHVKS